MLDLTPGERRGAITLVLLLLLGAAHDVWQAHQPPAPAPASLDLRPSPSLVPDAPRQGADGASAARETAPVDLNQASVAELDALPGIGPVLAGRIIAHRDRLGGLRSPDDLLAVQGIGPRLYARLAPHVVVRPRNAPESARARTATR